MKMIFQTVRAAENRLLILPPTKESTTADIVEESFVRSALPNLYPVGHNEGWPESVM